MADSKLTALGAASALDGAEYHYGSQGGVSVKITGTQIKTFVHSTYGSGVVTFLGTPSSANLASAITDETGSGSLVFGTSPTFTTSATITGGTVTANTPPLDISQTWNNSGVNFTGLKVNITNTAAGVSSKLFDVQYGGTSVFFIDVNGRMQAQTTGGVNYMFVDGNHRFYFVNRIQAMGNILLGSSGYINGESNGLSRFSNDGGTGAGFVRTNETTVASLPSASTVGMGTRGFVTDASTTLLLGLGTTVTGGGSNKVPVYSDGTNWIYG